MPDLMTYGEVGRFVRLSRFTLWRLRRSDPSFPKAIRPAGRKILFDRREIEKWARGRCI